jgi:two-component system response regulator RegA
MIEDQFKLLLVDDDLIYCEVLADSLTNRGFEVITAHDVNSALELLVDQDLQLDYAIIDLKMPGSSGLALVEQLHTRSSDTNIIVLTGYASIATAVEAIKLSATHYLTKPADADEIIAAFQLDAGSSATSIADKPISINRLEWEHIQKILTECHGNISLAARQLGMHRRTLQRKLQKRPVKH